jgi:hypothetical protein
MTIISILAVLCVSGAHADRATPFDNTSVPPSSSQENPAPSRAPVTSEGHSPDAISAARHKIDVLASERKKVSKDVDKHVKGWIKPHLVVPVLDQAVSGVPAKNRGEYCECINGKSREKQSPPWKGFCDAGREYLGSPGLPPSTECIPTPEAEGWQSITQNGLDTWAVCASEAYLDSKNYETRAELASTHGAIPNNPVELCDRTLKRWRDVNVRLAAAQQRLDELLLKKIGNPAH